MDYIKVLAMLFFMHFHLILIPSYYFVEYLSKPLSENQRAEWLIYLQQSISSANDLFLSKYKEKAFVDYDFIEKVNKKRSPFFYNTIFKEGEITPIFNTRHASAHEIDLYDTVRIFIPQTTAKEDFLKYLKESLYKKGISICFTKNSNFKIPESTIAQPPSFSHIAFTETTLKKMDEKQFITFYEQQAILLKKTSPLYATKKRAEIDATIALLKQLEPYLFWYQEIPTTGMRVSKDKKQCHYPYLPHLFPLWQMAPTMGKGIDIVIIDSGIAAFSCKEFPLLKKHPALCMNVHFNNATFNNVHPKGIDVFEQFLTMFETFLVPIHEVRYSYKDLESNVLKWICEYLEYKTLNGIIKYLKKYGKPELFLENNRNNDFSETGKRALRRIEEGDKGFKPKGKAIQFHFVELMDQEHNQQKKVILESIPTTSIASLKKTLASEHGSHVAGIAAGNPCRNDKGREQFFKKGISGIAPHANIIMIKAFNESGGSSLATFTSAVKKAVSSGVHIVNMSIKLSDFIDPHAEGVKTLELLLALIPYPVIASGNDGDAIKNNYPGEFESYPARFDFIPFDVGAFAYDAEKKTCPIAEYSQFQKNIGPKFVAPGHNILNCGVVHSQKEETLYMFRDGTSMAAPLMSGFIALMLGEFENDFKREELLKTCYASTITMHKNELGWKERTLLGTLDMRTALFTLHVIRNLKQNKALKSFSFDILLKGTHALLFGMIEEYGKTYINNIDFKSDFMNFFTLASKKTYSIQESFSTFNQAITFATNVLLHCLNNTHALPNGVSSEVINSIKKTFEKKSTFIDTIPSHAQNRILSMFDAGLAKHKQFLSNPYTYFEHLKKSPSTIEKLVQSTYSLEHYWKQQITPLKQVISL